MDTNGNQFDSQSIGLRAQKKLLGKMASKNIAKTFIDDNSGKLLDTLYKVAKDYSRSKKTAEKLMKDMIKTVIKIGILYRNDQFIPEETELLETFKKKLRTACMTMISFFEVDFTFDKNFLSRCLNECSELLKELVSRHLTDKSLGRIDNVFQFFGNPAFLELLFRPDGPYRAHLQRMTDCMNFMLDDGAI